ncbi:MAG: pyridoxal-phosphate dependent enzyme, partial [Acidobacteriota bacterium]|nr:pyridoxal-phosphate dependent enzyme [Acidobacteriota bacterium]
FRPDQYSNPHNPQSHYETTGPEIWRDTDGTITHYVAGAGTGGTLCGAGRYLKEMNPAVRVVAADPEGSVYSGGAGRPYLTEGVGEDFWPANYDPAVVDEVVAVSDADAFSMARRVTREEGMLIGGSGGTAVAAALRVAESAPAGSRVVVVVPDSGRGYLSKVFNDRWMRDYGFLEPTGPSARDVLAMKEAAASGPELVLVVKERPVREAISRMRAADVSQLLVTVTDELPLAAKEVVGTVSELHLLQLAHTDPASLERRVEEVMDPVLPLVGVSEDVDSLIERLGEAPALIVLENGRPRGVLSASDVLSFLSARAPAIH